MKELFEIEEVEVDGVKGVRIVRNELFFFKDATRVSAIKTIREVKKELLERGAIND